MSDYNGRRYGGRRAAKRRRQSAAWAARSGAVVTWQAGEARPTLPPPPERSRPARQRQA